MPDESPPKDAETSEPKFRRRAEARPDEVLDAAIQLFSEKGYAAATVEQIAKRAGLSKGAVYLYFPSKKALLEGLVKRAVAPIADMAIGAFTRHHGDPRPVIRQFVTMIAANIGDPRAFAVPKLVIREAVNAPEIAQMYREQVLDRVIPALTAMIRQGVEGGHIRPVDPELTVRSVVGPILLHLMLAEVFDIRPSDGSGIDRLIDNHLTILFAGLEPEGAA